MYDIVLNNTGKLDDIFSGETDSIIFDAYLKKRSGDKTPYELNMHLVKFKNKEYIVAIARDITERIRVENALRESEEKFRTLAESSTAAIIVYQDNYIVSVNPAAERITGYSKDELLKMRTADFVHPDFKEVVQKRALARQRGAPAPSQYEIKIITRSGEVRWILLTAGRIMYHGKPAGMATMLDITDRKLAEEDRKRLIHDLGERIKELRALYGTYEIIQKGGSVSDTLQEITDILPPTWQYPEVTAARISLNGQTYQTSNFMETPWVQRADFHTADGKHGIIEVYYLEERPNEAEGPFLAEERALINSLAKMLMIYLDKRYAKEALLKSEMEMNAIIQGSPIPQFVIDKDHRIIHWNKALEEYSGIRSKDVMYTDQQWRAFYHEKRPCLSDLLVDGAIDKIPLWFDGKYAKLYRR